MECVLVMKRFLTALLMAVPLLAGAQAQYREYPLASGAVTTSGAGSNVDTQAQAQTFYTSAMRVFINCTAVTGTSPSATFTLQGIVSGVAYNIASGVAITAAGQQTFVATDIPSVVRLSWTVAGTTPSFTCTASGVRQ